MIYYKVEMKIAYEKHNHIEKDSFTTMKEAEECFSTQFKFVEFGYLQNKIKKYSLALAECDTEKQLTKVYKIRNAPL